MLVCVPYRGCMTSAQAIARRERELLCNAFDQVGPDAPTLCEGWRTRDLAAHLIVREARPDAAVGLVIPALRHRLANAMATIAAKPWSELVNLVRSGPPTWSPMRYAEGLANVVEFVVHREDVLRAQGQPTLEDRDRETMSVLWQRVNMSAPLMFRHDAVDIVCPDFGHWRSRRSRSGLPTVTVTGSPVEVLLLATGRPHHCTIDGDSQVCADFQQRRRAI